jgi:hypothetical protein
MNFINVIKKDITPNKKNNPIMETIEIETNDIFFSINLFSSLNFFLSLHLLQLISFFYLKINKKKIKIN